MNRMDPLSEFCQKYNVDNEYLAFQLGMGGGTFSPSYAPNWQNTTIYNVSSDYTPAWRDSSVHTTATSGNLIDSSSVAGGNTGYGLNQSFIGGINQSSLSDAIWGASNFDKSMVASPKSKTTTESNNDKAEQQADTSALTVKGNTVTMNGYTASVDKNGYITYKDKNNKTVTVQEIIKANCSELVDKANEVAKSKKTNA